MLSRLREEAAQGYVEYGLLLMLIAIALVLLLVFFGEEVVAIYNRIIAYLPFI